MALPEWRTDLRIQAVIRGNGIRQNSCWDTKEILANPTTFIVDGNGLRDVHFIHGSRLCGRSIDNEYGFAAIVFAVGEHVVGACRVGEGELMGDEWFQRKLPGSNSGGEQIHVVPGRAATGAIGKILVVGIDRAELEIRRAVAADDRHGSAWAYRLKRELLRIGKTDQFHHAVRTTTQSHRVDFIECLVRGDASCTKFCGLLTARFDRVDRYDLFSSHRSGGKDTKLSDGAASDHNVGLADSRIGHFSAVETGREIVAQQEGGFIGDAFGKLHQGCISKRDANELGLATFEAIPVGNPAKQLADLTTGRQTCPAKVAIAAVGRKRSTDSVSDLETSDVVADGDNGAYQFVPHHRAAVQPKLASEERVKVATAKSCHRDFHDRVAG